MILEWGFIRDDKNAIPKTWSKFLYSVRTYHTDAASVVPSYLLLPLEPLISCDWDRMYTIISKIEFFVIVLAILVHIHH